MDPDPSDPPPPDGPAVLGPHPADDRLLLAVVGAQLALVASLFSLFAAAMVFDWVGFFGFALLSGSLGASLALLRRCQRGEVAVGPGRVSLVVGVGMPCLYGALMAGIAYFLFASEIVSGDGGDGLLTTNLFPLFTMVADSVAVAAADSAAVGRVAVDSLAVAPAPVADSVAAATPYTDEVPTVADWLRLRPATFPDAGKLIVWSVVAGYSEGFVTGILQRLDRSTGT